MTIAAHSLSNVVTGTGLPLSGPTEDPDWLISVFGVRGGADRLSSAAVPARPLPMLEVGPWGRATAAQSHLFNTRLIQHYGQFDAKAVFDCSWVRSVQMAVSQ